MNNCKINNQIIVSKNTGKAGSEIYKMLVKTELDLRTFVSLEFRNDRKKYPLSLLMIKKYLEAGKDHFVLFPNNSKRLIRKDIKDIIKITTFEDDKLVWKI